MEVPTAENFIESLKAQIVPVGPEDTMAEAGRKALLPDLVEMLSHQEGSLSGDDIEDVHDMRVAIRRTRSVLSLLSDYYKPKPIRGVSRSMRKVARVLGAVRDLDVLMENLQTYQQGLDDAGKASIQIVLDRLDGERTYARHDLTRTLGKGAYRRFVQDYSTFLTTVGMGARPNENGGAIEVRHILPTLIYAHLGSVRAFDPQIADADMDTLHALRIEFKRLRYLVSLFEEVLGTTAKQFITELKVVQDHLGNLHDSHVAQERLGELLSDLSETDGAALSAYIDTLKAEEESLHAHVGEVWSHFNSKTVQRQIANAIATL